VDILCVWAGRLRALPRQAVAGFRGLTSACVLSSGRAGLAVCARLIPYVNVQVDAASRLSVTGQIPPFAVPYNKEKYGHKPDAERSSRVAVMPPVAAHEGLGIAEQQSHGT